MMDARIFSLCIDIALKIGPALYNQLVDLLGPKIPSWDDLARENAALAAMIEDEEK